MKYEEYEEYEKNEIINLLNESEDMDFNLELLFFKRRKKRKHKETLDPNVPFQAEMIKQRRKKLWDKLKALKG